MPDRLVVVLNDGETYTDIEGCRILMIPSFVEDEPLLRLDPDQYVKQAYALGEGLSVSEQLVKDRA